MNEHYLYQLSIDRKVLHNKYSQASLIESKHICTAHQSVRVQMICTGLDSAPFRNLWPASRWADLESLT